LKKHEAPVDVKIYVITVSSSRYKKYGDLSLNSSNLSKINDIDDESGKILISELQKDFNVIGYSLVPDDEIKILACTFQALEKANTIIICGGTGLNPKDVTVEAIKKIIDKEIVGFGEILRVISYKEIGDAAILTRAFAGIYKGRAIFCIPGSPNAVRTSLNIIRNNLRHILSHAQGLV